MIELSPYNFVIYQGTSKKSGKQYCTASLDTDVSFNQDFINRLKEQGTKVVNVDELKKRKS